MRDVFYAYGRESVNAYGSHCVDACGRQSVNALMHMAGKMLLPWQSMC